MTSEIAQIALVGFGTIGKAIVRLTELQSLADVVCILVRERRKQTTPTTITSIDELLGCRPDVVIECAGKMILLPTDFDKLIQATLGYNGKLNIKSIDLAPARPEADARCVVQP